MRRSSRGIRPAQRVGLALKRSFDMFLRGLGPCLVIGGMVLVLGLAYLYFSIPVVPFDVGNFTWFAWTCVGVWFLVNLLFNWIVCVMSDPGSVKRAPMDSTKEVVNHDGDSISGSFSMQELMGTCKKCNGPKPQRAHHCQVCRKCVLAMDHHCPWVNNCVGYYNYRHFFLFMLYVWLATGFCVVAALRFNYVLPGLQGRVEDAETGRFVNRRPKRSLMFFFMMNVSVNVAISILLGWHVYLVRTGQTTIEFHTNQDRKREKRRNGLIFVNPYDLGTTNNWRAVFGKSQYPFQWMMPSLKKRSGDGINWPTCKSLLMEDQV